ncbi:MAG: hypothetical protein IT203_00085, partial [Fimbriimonadaceae bacterium]|nr:hypothetical protein [Fimbriimonadaceae bacterium]
MKRHFFTLALSLAVVAVQAQSDPAVVQKIIDEGKNRNQVMATLKELTDKFGPRLTSSTNLERAQHWAMDQFRKYGCTNV